MRPGLVSAVFVGRAPELAGLLAALEAAFDASPSVALVGGEAAVGKTRLVEEAAARARERGARVLTGSCIELGGEGLPLSPLVDVLRSLMRTMDSEELWETKEDLRQVEANGAAVRQHVEDEVGIKSPPTGIFHVSLQAS